MALPILVVPKFADVPIALGVPPVLRDPLGLVTAVSNAIVGPMLTGDGSSIGNQAQSAPQWGIFDANNSPVIQGDTLLDFEFLKEKRVADYPIEEGGFQSYNKISLPIDLKVTMAQGGSQDDRTAFIAACDAAEESLDLYTVVTPEHTYQSMNVDHVGYSRKRDAGAFMIVADIWLVEVRVTATQKFTNTASPSGADTKTVGAVQALPPTTDQAAATAGGAT